MSELTLLILRIAFLALLWAFVFAVVYALRSDLFGSRVRKVQEQPAFAAPTPPVHTPPAVQSLPTGPPVATQGSKPMATTKTASRLVITSGPKSGLEIPLGTEPLTIGRSSESGFQIRDDYTSTHHARLLLWSDEWVIQDLDSTNGTFLDGKRITVPTQVPMNTPIKVGATSFELRR
ncbi:FHA domain-containing protein [Herbiconiux sp. L3-i23]|jgi:pSer/pThr/pTyr-binding forkhead associated (FHA) protein|uniref:FHA domain-containing protein FhaB/FipA n=1 Tax=Herbiconiux sp. L3-i23 TaxID=2905871 RepID=UPI00205282BA|nr:FHA domain-containing protein [Herbiconiux sp. L3-i23]BDI21246.1 FHA domain-containing protein [Herbiconiux sp. L3-i23]